MVGCEPRSPPGYPPRGVSRRRDATNYRIEFVRHQHTVDVHDLSVVIQQQIIDVHDEAQHHFGRWLELEYYSTPRHADHTASGPADDAAAGHYYDDGA
jgi:hypothetical protein